MLATILAERPWLSTVALVAIVAGGLVVGPWLVGRPKPTRVLLAVSVGAVAALTLIPTRRDLAVGCAVEWAFPTFGAVELMANVVMFAPPVFLAAVLTRRPLASFLAASAISALIETAQALVTALGRSCSTNDWLSNTLGALLGAGLAVVVFRLSRSGPPRPESVIP